MTEDIDLKFNELKDLDPVSQFSRELFCHIDFDFTVAALYECSQRCEEVSGFYFCTIDTTRISP